MKQQRSVGWGVSFISLYKRKACLCLCKKEILQPKNMQSFDFFWIIAINLDLRSLIGHIIIDSVGVQVIDIGSSVCRVDDTVSRS